MTQSVGERAMDERKMAHLFGLTLAAIFAAALILNALAIPAFMAPGKRRFPGGGGARHGIGLSPAAPSALTQSTQVASAIYARIGVHAPHGKAACAPRSVGADRRG